MKNLIAFVGFKSSGKDTAASYFIDNFGYDSFAFADAIKDCLSTIFCWNRALLEGDTPESRAWRDRVDVWWADRLGIPEFTPRFAMTHFGTDLMRNHFNDGIWIMNTMRRVDMGIGSGAVIRDARFPNEIDSVRIRQGILIRVRRGPEPDWYDTALAANNGCEESHRIMLMSDVHHSEWAWIGQHFHATVENDGTIPQLHRNIAALGIV